MRRIQRYRWDDLALDKITDMVACKVIATAKRRLTQAYFKKGAIVPRHADAGELVIYVLQGTLRLDVDGTVAIAREGDVVVIPAGTAHETESLDDSFVLVVG